MPRHFSIAAEHMADQLPYLPFPRLQVSLKSLKSTADLALFHLQSLFSLKKVLFQALKKTSVFHIWAFCPLELDLIFHFTKKMNVLRE